MTASLPQKDDVRSILEHVRGQFQYHATQRLNTIRYFFVAYAIFAAAYVSTMTERVAVPSYVQLTIAFVALVITVGFWMLDWRNVQMIHIDEAALIEIEELVARRYEFEHFEMAKAWDARKYPVIQYTWVVNALFIVIALVTFLAVCHDSLRTFCHS
jgi:hypothetical protein